MKNYKSGIFFGALFSVGFVTAFLCEPSVMLAGAKRGLDICAGTVIASLFPFMVVSDFIVRSGLSAMLGRAGGAITRRVFRLPGNAAGVILMSLVGGFPVGARMSVQLLESGDLTENQARRLTLFCVNGGPAFVIGAVGTSMLSSKRAGILLYASLCIGSLAVGFLLRFFADEEDNRRKIMTVFDGGALTESVSRAVDATLNICGWIVLFSCVNSLAQSLIKNETVRLIFSAVGEVTGGCAAVAGKLPAFWLAGVIGWSGLAVHCQLLPYLRAVGIKLRTFWFVRAVNALLSLAAAWVLFRIFPCETDVFAAWGGVFPRAFSVSAPAAAAMLIMSAVMLLDSSAKLKSAGDDY